MFILGLKGLIKRPKGCSNTNVIGVHTWVIPNMGCNLQFVGVLQP